MATSTSSQPDLDRAFTKGRFKDRVYIVTGGTAGIGLATTERLCSDGAKVAIFARGRDRGAEIERRLLDNGYKVRFYSVDVTQEDQCERGVQEVVREFGDAIHGLVNNAAVPQVVPEKGEDITAAEFEKMLAHNVKGPLYMVKSCLPFLKKGENSAIVNVSSIADDRASRCQWGYSSSKAGLVALTRSMALDLSSYGIRVNCVSLGAIWTNWVESACGDRAQAEPIISKLHMMKRLGEASEVAAAITFLLSKDASFITGARLYVDGGSNAMCPPIAAD